MRRNGALLAAVLLMMVDGAAAMVRLEGELVASATCEAVVSIRKGTNPGNFTTTIGRRYQLTGKNKDVATHYQIVVPGAREERRWVAVACGQRVTDGAGADPGDTGSGNGGGTGGGRTPPAAPYILAVSWQPAFCERRTDTRECRTMTPSRRDATRLSLHGLWPEPRSNIYCKVSSDQIAIDRRGRFRQLDPLDLEPSVRSELDLVMPGTRSGLHRHEWVKHGSCYLDGSVLVYYRHSLALMRALDGSAVQTFFADRIGRTVNTADIRGAFDEAFGRGAGLRVRFTCTHDGRRRLITEMRLHLRGVVGDQPRLDQLLLAADPVGRGCTRGIIDRAGLQ